MRKCRSIIARHRGLIRLFGLEFAGLHSGSDNGFKSTYSLTFILLVDMAIATRARGAFRCRFAVASWACFVIGFGPCVGPEPLRAVNRNRNRATSVSLHHVLTDKLSIPDSLGGFRNNVEDQSKK